MSQRRIKHHTPPAGRVEGIRYAWQQGERAARLGQAIEANPYRPPGSRDCWSARALAWRAGWQLRTAILARRQNPV